MDVNNQVDASLLGMNLGPVSRDPFDAIGAHMNRKPPVPIILYSIKERAWILLPRETLLGLTTFRYNRNNKWFSDNMTEKIRSMEGRWMRSIYVLVTVRTDIWDPALSER